jgi:hypothetical protein
MYEMNWKQSKVLPDIAAQVVALKSLVATMDGCYTIPRPIYENIRIERNEYMY